MPLSKNQWQAIEGAFCRHIRSNSMSEECENCNGTGVCQICNGTGFDEGEKCGCCFGKKVCPECDGTGEE
jgi:hypothetical protein